MQNKYNVIKRNKSYEFVQSSSGGNVIDFK